MAGGFTSGVSAGGGGGGGGGGSSKVKTEDDVVVEGNRGGGKMMQPQGQDLMRVQTLGGRVKIPEQGDPVYMLAAFRGSKYSCLVSCSCSYRSGLVANSCCSLTRKSTSVSSLRCRPVTSSTSPS